MSRIVLGNRGTPLALSQSRTALSELAAEWPDVQIVQRTISSPNRARPAENGTADELLAALAAGKITIALLGMESLPGQLPEGLMLAAVTRRLEPRQALVAKGRKSLQALPQGARVGVLSARDRAFLRAARAGLEAQQLSGNLDQDLSLLSSGELEGLLVPASSLIELDRRQLIDALLEFAAFPTAVGQGCLGLVVKSDDYAAQDLAYTLQHRPSFDRMRAERSFAAALEGRKASGCVAALASVDSEGELHLFGALADADGVLMIQAEISGEAAEAEELGRELAQDVLEQLETQSAS